MKLSNQQIDSLVSKADSKRREEIRIEQEKLKKSVEKDVKKAIEEATKILEKLPTELKEIVKKHCSSYNNPGFKNVYGTIESNIQDKALKQCKLDYLNTNQLRQDIILATIDAVDLKDLCTKLKLEL